MMHVRLSPLARRDLVDVWTYVAVEASEARADAVVDQIVGALEMLAAHPGIGRLRPEFGSDVRSFPVAGYVVYYRADATLLVARVLHGKRDQAAAWHETGA